jgi:mono/diheme cytochrome c family protein
MSLEQRPAGFHPSRSAAGRWGTHQLAAVALLISCSVAAQAAEPSSVLPEGQYRELVIRTCAVCHPIDKVVAQRRTADEWDQIMGTMLDRGARATEAEQDHILEYLVEHFGKTP